ncbi:MipA/OmpV family protein [Aurantiacibacter marinus]|uniref:Structural protein MipA n=1 Tax=Aurantiacibacter marinus TaxID=874156 RepID=A0A0H0XRS9_9SPHN|nr:MipA/OmpV family protein [Aurantiacibacter marinus]KLI62980.1 structural protein MipA [Aurantiacibacter marinus]
MQLRPIATFSAIACAALASPSLAQDVSVPADVVEQAADEDRDRGGPPEGFGETVFDGDFLTIGVGGAISPSYTGSDEYVFSALPVIQGSFGGVRFSPRAAGLTVDFIPNPDEGVGFDVGFSARVRSNRADRIKDDVVAQYGELDRAIEVGPSVGVSFPKLLNPFDSLSIKTDVMFDVAGAHGGTVVSPSISYFTPINRGVATSLTLSTEWADEDFQDYNFAVNPAYFTGAGASPLAAYDPDGGGFTSAGATLLVGVDLDGDVTNGGLSFVTILGYSHLLGDAADTPFTSVRGSRSQFLGVLGLAYTF